MKNDINMCNRVSKDPQNLNTTNNNRPKKTEDAKRDPVIKGMQTIIKNENITDGRHDNFIKFINELKEKELQKIEP